MKKMIIILCCMVVLFTGCGKQSNIAKLQNEIDAIETEIIELEQELYSWQGIYDDALNTYNQYKYSSSMAVQTELKKKNSMMDEAYDEVIELQRKIDLKRISKTQLEKELNNLIND